MHYLSYYMHQKGRTWHTYQAHILHCVVVKESELEVILHNLATVERRGGSGLSQSWTAV
jgi:hypothetical protein